MRHFLLVISILSMATISFGKLYLEHQWKYVELFWESPQQKYEAIMSGRYNASAAFFYDVDKGLDGRVFLTAGSDKTVVPASILTVSEKQGETGPLLRPYPDWSWYKDGCNGITGAVYNIEIKCNHMFLVDNGQIRKNQVCSPQLLIFDLYTDKLVKRVPIPIEIAHHKNTTGVLSSVAVFTPFCRNVKDDAVVFMADSKGSGLVVYNGRTSKMCRVESDSMKIPPDPNFVIENKTYHFSDTVHGMTIIGKDLYYATFMGRQIYKVEFQKLIDCSPQDINEANRQTQSIALEGPTTMLASHRCSLFFSDVTKRSIMCANVTKNFNSINKELVAHDPKMEFSAGLKVRNGELLILSNRFPLTSNNNLNRNEINFRYFSIPITDIENNTNCFSFCN